jgi:hypothetical protein
VELEQRVKALEYELKILKNEIQRTLLGIQEQVLVHYYPALRSEESAPSDGTLQAIEAIRAKQVTMAPPPSTPVPVAKKVTLDEIRATSNVAAAPQPAVASPSAPMGDQAIMVKLSGWVSDSAAKLGRERTTKLIQTIIDKGILSIETKDVLLRMASLNKEAAPEKVAANEILAAILKLDEMLGRAADIEEALAVIEEANLG